MASFISQGIFERLLILVASLVPCFKAEFSVIPSNMSLPVGSAMKAVFGCTHESTEAFINWRVNGSSNLAMFSDIVVDSFHNGSATLTIPVKLEYDGLEVVCVAFIYGVPPVSETTPTVTLTVLAGPTASTVMTTEREMMTTDVEVSTQEPAITGFDKVPTPTQLTVTLGEWYTYMCNHSETKRIVWKINDRVLGVEINDIPGINYTDFISNRGGAEVYTLTIRALPQNNETTIQCTAAFSGASSPEETPISTLLIQGPLQNVSNLIRNDGNLFWEPPFSLDLTDVDPDIVYCVEVYNITCGRRDLIISDCNVTEPSYISYDNAPHGYIYEYTVTPRSNVNGARNGTSLTVIEQFLKFNGSSMRHSVSMMNGAEREYSPHVMMCYVPDISTGVSIHMNMHQLNEGITIKPESYSVFLNSLDGISTHGELLDAAIYHEKENTIVLEEIPLAFKRLWNVTVFAHDCEHHPLTDQMELGTHNFHNIFITSPPNSSVVMVTGDIIPGSTALGILVIVYSLTNDSNVHYHFIKHTQFRVHPTAVGSVMDDEYQVVVFDVERDGKPFCRAAATPRTVQINGTVQAQPPPIEYELHATSTRVCVNCIFMDNSTTDCVAVIHQRISQLSSSGLMNIESSHKFTGSDDTAYGCIEGVDLEQYQVGVVGGIRKLPNKPKNMPQSVGILMGILAALIFTVLLVVIILLAYVGITKRRQKRFAQGLKVSDTLNEYEMVQPLSRIPETDGEGDTHTIAPGPASGQDHTSNATATPTNLGEGSDLDSNIAPPLPPPRSKDTHPVYTEAVTVSGSSTVHRQPATEVVVYDDIKAFKNKDVQCASFEGQSWGQQYAILPNLRKTGEFIDPDPNRTVYSEIQHVLSTQQVQTTDTSSLSVINTTKQLKEDTTGPTLIPFTIEHLLPELLPHASKWQLMGLALSLDDDRLDEIFTNNETDEACLQEMLEVYMARPDLNHSWEEVQEALKKAREESAVNQLEVSPGEESVTIQLEVPSTVSDEVLTEQEDSQDQEITSLQPPSEKEDPPDNTKHTEPKDDGNVHHPSQQGMSWSDNQQECVDVKGDKVSADLDEGLTEEQNSQDHEIINTSPSEKDDPPHSPQHTEPRDDRDTQDISQQGANLSDTQQEHADAEETGSLTDDNRNVYDVKKSEEDQSNSYTPVPFNTQCEEHTIDQESGEAI